MSLGNLFNDGWKFWNFLYCYHKVPPEIRSDASEKIYKQLLQAQMRHENLALRRQRSVKNKKQALNKGGRCPLILFYFYFSLVEVLVSLLRPCLYHILINFYFVHVCVCVCVCVFTPPLPWDGGTAWTVIQVHAVNLIDIRLGEDGSPFRTSLEWLVAPPPTRRTATGGYPRVV